MSDNISNNYYKELTMTQYVGNRVNFMGDYPPGAANDPLAPYNEVYLPEKLFDVTLSCSLSKDVSVFSDNYDPYGNNGAGELDDPLEAYKKHNHTVCELLDILKRLAEEKLKNNRNYSRGYINKWTHIIEECNGWTVDEENAEQI